MARVEAANPNSCQPGVLLQAVVLVMTVMTCCGSTPLVLSIWLLHRYRPARALLLSIPSQLWQTTVFIPKAGKALNQQTNHTAVPGRYQSSRHMQ
jgi:hypothetical protein